MSSGDRIYLLWHVRSFELDGEIEDDEKLLGAFTTPEKARTAIFGLLEKPGFRDCPEGFEISGDKLDQDSWTEGFANVCEEE